MAVQPESRRTYGLVASSAVDTGPVEAAFQAAGWVPIFGSPSPAAERLRRVDLLVAVAGPQGTNDRVFFELGYAVGRRRLAVLLLSPGAELPPTPLERVGVFSTQDVADAAGWAAAQIELRVATAAESHVAPTHGLGESAFALISAVRQDSTAQATASVLEEALVRLGARTHPGVSTGEGRQIDLAAWEPTLGARWNPVIFEVKRPRAGVSLSHAARQLRQYGELTDARLAVLVLTADSPVDAVAEIETGRLIVLAFGVIPLLRELKDRRLGPVLIDAIGESAYPATNRHG